MGTRHNSKTFILIFLGALTAFGPFITDMYLSTLPEMTSYFATSSSIVQLGLTASMAGLAVGQLFFGPISDKYGRRPPLIIALLLFLISTVGCLLSTDISRFVAWRLVQGIAGAGGIVISRSVATDKYSGRDLGVMLATIGAINGVAPIAAPMIGGFVGGNGGWQSIFWILFGIGLLLLIGSLHFSESLPREKRGRMSWGDVFRSFGTMLHNRRYLCYILQFAFAQAVIFANISSAPFIMQEHYGFSPLLFSICFGINAIAIVVSAAASVRFKTPQQALNTGCIGMVAFSTVLCTALALDCNFWIYEILLVGLLSMLGLTFTASNTLAMDAGRENAGTASALLGALGFAAGGLVSPLVGIGNMMHSTGIIFVAGSLCSYIFARKGLQYEQDNEVRS